MILFLAPDDSGYIDAPEHAWNLACRKLSEGRPILLDSYSGLIHALWLAGF